MSFKRLCTFLAATVATAAAVGFSTSPSLAAKTTTRCPGDGTPPPGATVNGLEVDGQCFVDSIRALFGRG